MFPTYNSPMPMMGNRETPGSAAQYGLQILPSVLNALLQQGRINMQTYSVLNQEMNKPESQDNIIRSLNATYGWSQVSASAVQNTVQQIIMNAVTKYNQSQMMQNPAMMMSSNMYASAAYNPVQQNTFQNSMQPMQQQAPMYQQPVPKQDVNMPIPKAQVDVSISDDVVLCEEATSTSLDNIDDARKDFDIPDVQSLINGNSIKCGALTVTNMDFIYKIPMPNRQILFSRIKDEQSSYAIMPDEYSHVNLVEWYRMYPFPHSPAIQPTKLMDKCRDLYKEFESKRKSDPATNVIPFIQEINKTILSDGGTFGISLEQFVISQINKYASVVFHYVDSKTGKIRCISGFDDFKDFDSIISAESSELNDWKQDASSYCNALSRLITTVYKRLFYIGRKSYLDYTSEADRQLFINNPYVPYSFNGKPFYMTSVEDRDTSEFQDTVTRSMKDCPVIVMTQRTLFHNLKWNKELTSKRVVLETMSPTEQVFQYLLKKKYISLLEVVNDIDMDIHVLGQNYNKFLILKAL